jgi:hypothetical protein
MMLRFFVGTVLLSTLFSVQQSTAAASNNPTSSSEPSLPVVDENACPFEGCTFGTWKATKESTLYSSWQTDRAEIGKIKAGEPVTSLTGVHITRKPDRILVKREISRLALKPGDLVLRYMYVGEGFANIWAKGTWHKEEDCSFITEKDGGGCARECAAVVAEDGQKEWWVKIKTRDGKLGWILVKHNFEGMDALAE